MAQVELRGPRRDLGMLLEHIQQNTDRLMCDAVVTLAAAISRMSDGGSLKLDTLPQSDIDELWGLVDDIARENGLAWEVT